MIHFTTSLIYSYESAVKSYFKVRMLKLRFSVVKLGLL